MKRLLQITVFLLVLTAIVSPVFSAMTAGKPPDFILRSAVRPNSGIWVGQQVLLYIDVLGRNGWAQIPKMPDIEVSGAILVSFESQATRLNENIDGESYSGQRYELFLFPQRTGRITLPRQTVEIQLKQWARQTEIKIVKGEIPSVHFNAQMVPGAENTRGMVSTTRLTANQTWVPDVTKVAVGDAVKREIHLEADSVSGMTFTPMVFPVSDVVDIYPRVPEVKDVYDRGSLSGQRTESVTYLFKKAGSVELPAVTLTWWDLQNKKIQETVLPSRVIEIAPAITGNGDISAVSASGYLHAVFITVLIVLIIFAAGLRKPLRAQWAAWSDKRQESERNCFRRFAKAARSGQPVNTFNALMRWLDRIEPRARSSQLRLFLSIYADEQTIEEAERLCRFLADGSQSHWQGRKLVEGFCPGTTKLDGTAA
ncbi:BatD family protein [Desulforhopalus singaporensis]|uniref:Oxygen tolerance n=1 Tax=Desulforhopalus singaporensis TaxID=91360 RepID=A0A1H0VH35_9BACT|nr:BatD family protein [Desulforhopalus singaporensis]SDP77396.1 Oxygen tolerance [Desulforhopalus singaporensis]